MDDDGVCVLLTHLEKMKTNRHTICDVLRQNDQEAVPKQEHKINRKNSHLIPSLHFNAPRPSKMLRLVFAVVLAMAYGQDQQTPQRCCISHQFTATLGEVGMGVKNARGVPVDGYNFLTYDYDAKVMTMETHVTNGPNTPMTNTTVVIDYNAHTQYVTTDSGKCFYSPVPGPMREPCIPANATYVGTVMFGSSADNLKANVWQLTPAGMPEVTAKLAVSVTDCTPIAEGLYGKMQGTDTEVTYFFTNVQRTIADRSPLTIPQNCAPLPTASSGNPPVGRRSIPFS